MSRILIVDDRPTDRSLLAVVLAHGGHDVLQASEGATALALVRRHAPDLVITDIVLPVMDGYELVRRLRVDAATAATRVMLYTAHYDRSELERFASDEQVQAVISKPVRPEVLLDEVQRCLAAAAPRWAPARADSADEHLRLVSEKLLQKVEELEAANRDIRALLAAVVDVRESERARIARDVHDDPIQVLAAAMTRLEVLRSTLVEPAQIEAVDQVDATLGEAVARLRRLVFDLVGPDLEGGLGPSMREALQAVFQGGEVVWDVDDRLAAEPDAATSLVAFRIAQEAIANACHHADATAVSVTLSDAAPGLRVTIADDGRGFDPEAPRPRVPGSAHLGMVSMRERAELGGGSIQVRSALGAGTTVEVWLPVLGDASLPDPLAASSE